MEKKEAKKFIGVGVFAIAMAFVESSVVVYLRKLYYALGFNFPFNADIPKQVIIIEGLREISTIVMLLAIAFIVANKAYRKFAYFLYAFAVWDIFYYIWLKALLNWPASFFEWDVLFLIPVPWTGPVIAPIIISLTMIALSAAIVHFSPKKINLKEWFLLSLGALIIFISFIWDYSALLIKKADIKDLISGYAPHGYQWGLFAAGEMLIIIGIIMIGRNRESPRRLKG